MLIISRLYSLSVALSSRFALYWYVMTSCSNKHHLQSKHQLTVAANIQGIKPLHTITNWPVPPPGRCALPLYSAVSPAPPPLDQAWSAGSLVRSHDWTLGHAARWVSVRGNKQKKWMNRSERTPTRSRHINQWLWYSLLNRHLGLETEAAVLWPGCEKMVSSRSWAVYW